MKIQEVQEIVWEYYRANKRTLEWREKITPYGVFVSEIMLQQTQVSRVQERFPQFIARFSSFESLASAQLSEVLEQWQGMGYNRRAKFLYLSAQKIMNEHGGILPKDPLHLVTLPGIGPNTAGSISAFAFQNPVIFIETNIRRVVLYHFFQGQVDVHDKLLMPIIEQLLDHENPREWYYALMDYGSYLKTQVPNPNRTSKHYTIQSKFDGSNRQVRSAILRLILQHKSLKFDQIASYFPKKELRILTNLTALEKEGMIDFNGLEAKIRE
jgi:A/G-specific adenine glycosylase